MSSNAIETQSTILKMGDTSGVGITTVIGEVTSFSGPGGSATVIDVSNLASTAKEKLMGLADEGQFKFEINYVPGDTGHKALIAARASRAKKFFKLIYSNDAEAAWAGYVLAFEISGGVDAVVGASVTIEITGSVTHTDPA
jgi:hypothetical protein